MKKIPVTLGILWIVSNLLFTSCNTPKQKVVNAENRVEEATADLDKANKEYENEVAQYRAETSARMMENDKSALEFRKRIEHEKKDAKANYNKRIASLEQKNSDMKKKMDEYKLDTKENWNKFKKEFNHDMDELGAAFKDLTVKNIK